MTCRSHQADPVQLLRIAEIERLAVGVADAGRQHARRLVEVPMRVVGREQQLVPADPFDHLEQMLAPLRVFHRLRGPPDVVADVFRRLALEMRHLAAQPLETLVEPPGQRRRPAEAGLDHHHLQFRKALEHAFQHEARERGLLALRMADHLLDVEARPARRGDRIAAEAEGVHADRKPGLLRRLVDRPVAALAERLDVAAEQQHLHEILVAGALADFGGGGHAVLVGDDDRALQAAVLAGPFLDLPVVDRGSQSRRPDPGCGCPARCRAD